MVAVRMGIGLEIVPVLADRIVGKESGTLTGSPRHSAFAACRNPLEEHFLCSSSRPLDRWVHQTGCWDIGST